MLSSFMFTKLSSSTYLPQTVYIGDNPPDVTCGGFENCASYNDDCNSCFCREGSEFALCTRIGCIAPPVENQCQSCIDGYVLNQNNECELDEGCFCPQVFIPVCCQEINGFYCSSIFNYWL